MNRGGEGGGGGVSSNPTELKEIFFTSCDYRVFSLFSQCSTGVFERTRGET